ncbi:MAG: S41 family peptidase [Candidatus Spechtbacteria bacterium]|nr:S41 family peptidase [Candidatus Spechtbacteria bacterium]
MMQDESQQQSSKARAFFARVVLVIMLVGISFGAGLIVGQLKQTPLPTSILPFNSINLSGQTVPSSFSLIEDVWKRIHTQYVYNDKLDDSQLIYGAIRGMLGAVGDPYSVFFNPQESKDFLETVNGQFDGIGAEVGMRDSQLTIIAPLKDSPAERSGLKAADQITTIDSVSTKGMTLEEAVSKIRGLRGTNVVLGIARQNGEQKIFSITITRETIKVPSMKWEMKDGNIAAISFFQFSERSPQDFQKIVEEIQRADTRGIILDLRNNPGGYLSAAVDIAGWFLPKNQIVVTEDFGRENTEEHTTKGPATLQNMPLVVLINKGSASASEILAGALLDNRQVPLIGEKSFGKGSVQQLDSLSGGSSLKITVARWLTPSGRSIQEQGIDPTITVKQNESSKEDDQLNKALDTIMELIRNQD